MCVTRQQKNRFNNARLKKNKISSLVGMQQPSNQGRPMSIGNNPLTIDNPFIIPTDDQIFRIRDEERIMLNQQSKSRLKLWEKSKTDVLSFSARLREIVGTVCLVIYIQIHLKYIDQSSIFPLVDDHLSLYP